MASNNENALVIQTSLCYNTFMKESTRSGSGSTNGKSSLLSGLLIGGAVAASAVLHHILKIPCVYRLLFGIECPGCGMTRAVISLSRLKLSEATSYNYMVWSLPLLAVYLLTDGKPTKSKLANTLGLVTILIGFTILFVLRLFGILTVD